LQEIGSDGDEVSLYPVRVSDETTFYLNDLVNQQNCRIWGSRQPEEMFEYHRGTPKVIV
jgi:hypothetical protein